MKNLPRPNFGIRLLSTLLCLILFLSLLAGILVADVRIATTKENTAKIIRESLFTTHTILPPASRPGSPAGHGTAVRSQAKLAASRLAEDDSTGILTEALVKLIYDSLNEQYGGLPITLEEVEKFIDESTLKDDISNLSASLINDLVNGENTTVINEEVITNLVTENAGLIEAYFGFTVDEAAVSQMASAAAESEVIVQLQEEGINQVLLDSIAGSGGSDSIESDNISDTPAAVTEAANLLDSIRSAISLNAMLVCFGVAAVCIVLLCLLNRKWIWYALRRIGFTLIWASLPTLVPTIAVMTSDNMLRSLPDELAVVGTIATMILTMTAPVCIIAAAVGVVLVIVGIVLNVMAKKRLAAATAEPQKSAPVEAEPAVPEIHSAEEVPAEEVSDAEETKEEVSAE